jgi:hypothetical protein
MNDDLLILKSLIAEVNDVVSQREIYQEDSLQYLLLTQRLIDILGICEQVSCKHINTMKNLKEANMLIIDNTIKSKKLVDRGE